MQEWKQPQRHEDLPEQILQSLRCEITYQAVVSVHKAVAEYFRFQCPDGKSCQYSDCRKWHESRKPACKYGCECKRWRQGNQCTMAWHVQNPVDILLAAICLPFCVVSIIFQSLDQMNSVFCHLGTFLHPYAYYQREAPMEEENPLLQACHNCTARHIGE